jgi:hypothetical protein
MTKAEFAAELERLRRTHARALDNPLSYQCDGCEGCVSCTFCRDCQDCYRCSHCSGCRGASGCTQCRACADCHECSQCERCQGCRGSAYLVECYACNDCTYCYGCVGLSKKEFHILNVPYDRKSYFATVNELAGGQERGGPRQLAAASPAKQASR